MANDPKITVIQLKNDLKTLGAKVSGNKAELQQRLVNWKTHDLGRTLFDVPFIPTIHVSSSFPLVKEWFALEKLPRNQLEWITPTSISLYFEERQARKGFEKGRHLFMCEFVKSCMFHQDNENIFFKAICSAEMKTNTDYEIKLHINSEQCDFMKAQCQCPAGIGPGAACKHVSAVMFSIEFYIITGKVKQNLSCTSLLQQWHKPKGAGINLSKTTVNAMLGIPTPTINPNDEVSNFYLNMFSQAKCETPLVRKRFCNMSAYLNDHNYCKDNLEVMIINRMNAVRKTDIVKIEKKTRSNKKLWFKFRRTRITASIAHDVIRTCRSQRYATSFLLNHILCKPIRSRAIKWGITHEEAALKKYVSVMGGKFSKCGTMIDETRNYLSATPDAISDEKNQIIEIKCPYSVRDGKPESVNYLSSGRLQTSHKYYTQVQIQMHVSKTKFCDFVVWTPQGIYIQGIKYNSQLVNTYVNLCDFYYKNVFSKYYLKNVTSS